MTIPADLMAFVKQREAVAEAAKTAVEIKIQRILGEIQKLFPNNPVHFYSYWGHWSDSTAVQFRDMMEFPITPEAAESIGNALDEIRIQLIYDESEVHVLVNSGIPELVRTGVLCREIFDLVRWLDDEFKIACDCVTPLIPLDGMEISVIV